MAVIEHATSFFGRPSSLPVAIGGFAFAALLLFLGFRDLPMVDLPQHAAQIATWWRWHDPAFRADDYLELNLRTPYLLAYGLARLLAPIVGVVVALKLVVWAGLVTTMLSLTLLVRKLGHDAWLGLLGLPLAAGYSFYFGFVSFVFTTPLTLLCCVAALDHAERPRWRSGLALAALLCLTLVGHGVAFAIAGCSAGALLLRGGGTWQQRLAPTVMPLFVAAVWLPAGASMVRIGADIWDLGWHRVSGLVTCILGMGTKDWLAAVLGLALLALTLAACGRPARQPERWVLLLLAVAGFFLLPMQYRGYGFLSGRLSAFIVPGLLLGFLPRYASSDGPHRQLWLRASVLALVVVWFSTFSLRLAEFNAETAPLHQLIQGLPRGLRLRAIVFERAGAAFPGVPAFLHLPAYYQAEKGGILAHSFAIYPNSVLRTLPGIPPRMPLGAEWHPEDFRANDEVPRNDYFIVRSATDRSRELFGGSSVSVVLDARFGDWWGYRPLVARR